MRYMLFSGEHYYPSGGMNDCRGRYALVAGAVKALGNVYRYDWFQIYDTETGRVYHSHDVEVPNDSRIASWARSVDQQNKKEA